MDVPYTTLWLREVKGHGSLGLARDLRLKGTGVWLVVHPTCFHNLLPLIHSFPVSWHKTLNFPTIPPLYKEKKGVSIKDPGYLTRSNFSLNNQVEILNLLTEYDLIRNKGWGHSSVFRDIGIRNFCICKQLVIWDDLKVRKRVYFYLIFFFDTFVWKSTNR